MTPIPSRARAVHPLASAAQSSDSQLRRGLRVIEALAVSPRSAADAARLLGVNRSTTLRLLHELQAAGWVTRDARSKRFSIVPERLYALTANMDDHVDWTEFVHPVLAALRDEFREATMLGVPANGSMVYMAFFPSPNPVAVRERIGTVRPMHCSALGKAYLSALTQESLDVELGRLDYSGGTELAAKGPIELRARLDEVRERGYAADRDQTFEGVTCVAAPARIAGSLIGAAGVSGPSHRITPARAEELGARLVSELAKIDIALQR